MGSIIEWKTEKALRSDLAEMEHLVMISQNFCKSSIPPLTDDEIISTSKGKAEVFAKLFASDSILNSPANMPLPSIAIRVPYEMPEVKFIIKDEVPVIILKKCAPELALVLTRLYQRSYDGILTDDWKTVRVQPVGT